MSGGNPAPLVVRCVGSGCPVIRSWLRHLNLMSNTHFDRPYSCLFVEIRNITTEPAVSAAVDILNASATYQKTKLKRKSRPRVNIPTSQRATR